MTERDDFDKIVEGLEFDLTFPDEPAEPTPEPPPLVWAPESDDRVHDDAEPAYRQVPTTPLIPRHRGTLVAWAGVLGIPAALAIATVLRIFLDRAVLAGAALIFVAAAIYLFLQLPEHGPSRRDWPDDGAVL